MYVSVFCMMFNNFENVDISICVPYPPYLELSLSTPSMPNYVILAISHILINAINVV